MLKTTLRRHSEFLKNIPVAALGGANQGTVKVKLEPAFEQAVMPPERIYWQELMDSEIVRQFSEPSFPVPDIHLVYVEKAALLGRYIIRDDDGNAVHTDMRPRLRPPKVASAFEEVDESAAVRHDGEHFLLASVGDSQHHHWLFDVCSKLHVWENILNRNCKLAIPRDCKRYMLSTYADLGITDEHLTFFDPGKLSYFERLCFVPTFSQGDWLWWQALRYIRERLLDTFEVNKEREPFRKIFVDRSDRMGEARTLLNEAEIRRDLEVMGFESICPGRLALRDQVRVFFETKLGVVVHGSGGANVLFGGPNASFVHLQPDCIRRFRAHGRVNGLLQHRYSYVLGLSYEVSDRDHNNPWFVDPRNVADAVLDLSDPLSAANF